LPDKPRILVTGASGYLGPYLCLKLAARKDSEIISLYNSNPPPVKNTKNIKCDLTDFTALEKIFSAISPSIVYHLASVTPTRMRGREYDYVKYFNCDVTKKISELCIRHNSLLVYTSTDLVYNEGENLNEKSPLNPLTIYAKTKLLGENEVISSGAKYIITRISLVYGFTLSAYTSFFDTAYHRLKNGEQVQAFTDQFRNPLYTEDAAEILSELPQKYKSNDIINLCGDEYISRFTMCRLMAEEYGLNGDLVIPCSCDDFTQYTMVKRLGLDNSRLKNYGFKTDSYTTNLKKARRYM